MEESVCSPWSFHFSFSFFYFSSSHSFGLSVRSSGLEPDEQGSRGRSLHFRHLCARDLQQEDAQKPDCTRSLCLAGVKSARGTWLQPLPSTACQPHRCHNASTLPPVSVLCILAFPTSVSVRKRKRQHHQTAFIHNGGGSRWNGVRVSSFLAYSLMCRSYSSGTGEARIWLCATSLGMVGGIL